MKKQIRIGIDIGGTTVKIGLVSDDNEILRNAEVPTQTEKPYQEIIRNIGNACNQLMDECGVSREECRGVGIAMPGTVDPEKGVVLYSNNFGWEDIPLVEELSSYLPYPMAIANDADCAALGEAAAGAAKGYEQALMLTLGTGFGGGVILDGKIFTGKLRGGTELGHTVIVMDGELCTCGRRGCVEAYASATALIRQGKEAMEQHPESMLWTMTEQDPSRLGTKMLFDASKMGDKAAENVIHRYQRYLTASIANFVNIFRPQIVVIGGGLSRQEDYLLGPVNDALQKECFGGSHTEVPPVVSAKLLNDAGMIGAANLI